jgi:hypothetical protein
MSGGERSSASRMTAEEAVWRVRHEAGRLRAVRTVLEQMQAAIAAPSPQELAQMARGERPLSAEAHLLGVLRAAAAALDNVEADLRLGVGTKTLSRLEKDWERGDLPNELDLRLIRAALSERKA